MKRLEFRRAGIVPALLLGAATSLTFIGCGNSSGSGTGGGTSSGSGGDTLATVGSDSITRDELRAYLEGAQGTQGLRSLIDARLLEQSGKAKGLDVTDADVQDDLQDQLKDLKKQEAATPPTPGQQSGAKQLETVLSNGGPQLDFLKAATRSRLFLYKLLTQNIKATDAQLTTWFAKNHTRYDTTASLEWGLLASSTKVRAQTMLTQLRNKSRTFQQLVDEQKKANDIVGRSSLASTPLPAEQLPPTLKTPLLKLKAGQFTDVISAGSGARSAFVILTVVKSTPAQKADFKTMKKRVERDYKLEQLSHTATGDPQTQLLQSLRSSGTVHIDDTNYASVADDYKAAPSAAGTGNSTTGGNSASNSANKTP